MPGTVWKQTAGCTALAMVGASVCLQPVSGVGSAESVAPLCDTDIKQEFIMNE